MSYVKTIQCPYRYRFQFITWLYECKGWKRKDAVKLTTKQMYAIYYNSKKEKE